MASRQRIATSEKTHLDQDETKADPVSNISPAVPSSVIFKLLAFTFAMITVPIGSYFLSVNILFGGELEPKWLFPNSTKLTRSGNATYAGGFAAFMANVVLIGYVIVAFTDDQSEREAMLAEEKKKSR